MAAAEQPPERSRGILSDIRMFFLHRPEIPTRIRFSTPNNEKITASGSCSGWGWRWTSTRC